MKESCWEDCLESNASIKITPDSAKSRSLIKTAKGRIEYLREIIIKENNANYVFEGYYTSILELFHALIILKGYKVRNHICIGFYLRDILKKNDLFRSFDNLRFKRNSLTYYGKMMDYDIAKEAITDSKNLIRNINALLIV